VSELSQEQKKQIIMELEKRGATLPCPRCGNRNFVILEGYFNQPMSTEVGAIVLGGPTVPSVVIGCSRCGFLSQHALGILGMMPEKKDKGNG